MLVLPSERIQEEEQILDRVRSGRRVEHLETMRMTKDGRRLDVSVTVSAVKDQDGQIIGASKIVHDISDRKRAEEALRKSEQEFRALAEAVPQIVWATRPDGWNIYFNQQWMDYTGLTLDESYGHGWNTPFHPDDKQRAWDAWQRATQHNEPYLLECRLRRADGVYCRIPEETPDAVVGDRMRLQQVLLNLAGNAIKFTEQGEVEVSVRALSQDGEGCLEFAVRDTGIGISPSGQERLFQSFAQADASMTRRFGGTGLGLSICKSLVEMMGGRIWVQSEVGKGSTFRFTVHLPLAEELPSDVDAPVAVASVACAQLRILLAEDNPANQKLATYVLQDQGHLVEIAGDGREAIRLTRREEESREAQARRRRKRAAHRAIAQIEAVNHSVMPDSVPVAK